MKKIIPIILILISISLCSCKKTLDGDDVYNSTAYLELTLADQSYDSNLSIIGVAHSCEIGAASLFESSFLEIQTAKYRFRSSIIYLNNDTLFRDSKAGIFRLVQNNSDKTKNLDFCLSVLSKDSATINLVQFGVNNVTEIRLLYETNLERHYIVIGTFSAVYVNTKTNTTFPISGKYRFNITTCK
ncbi:MAG: hypothetical protein Q8904_08700 [Bacteroidota bacterium]|nr:hypothetical protein [Bacteroidota bacterium]